MLPLEHSLLIISPTWKNELKDMQWLAEQYLAHAFQVVTDNQSAFTGDFIGIDGDEIVLFMKVQTTDSKAWTQTKTTIHLFKTLCNLKAHVNTVLHPLIQAV